MRILFPCLSGNGNRHGRKFFSMYYRHLIISSYHQDTVVIQTHDESTKNSKFHTPLFDEFSRSSRDLCHYGGYNAMNPGTIGWIRPKVASEFSIFKWLKNREDGSDFDDFWTESIASAQIFFSQNFRADENFRAEKKKFAPTKNSRDERTSERTNEKKFSAALPVDEI